MKIVIDVDTDNPIHHAEGTDYFIPDLHSFISENLFKILKESCKVLPKTHGRLIDVDELLQQTLYNPLHAPYISEKDILNALTIIEADGGSK